MKNDIKEKLGAELSKPIVNEPQVVYILSRIRKILEINKNEKDYKKLKFYCDWALHAEIENVSAVKDVLDRIVAKESKATFDFIIFFDFFYEELSRFLKEYGLPDAVIKEKRRRFDFGRLLTGIYADTPLTIKTVKKKKITWLGSVGELSYGGSFKIEEAEQAQPPRS